MATHYLINNIRVVDAWRYAGELIDDVQEPIAGLTAQGAITVPSATAGVAAAAAIANEYRGRNDVDSAQAIMLAAVAKAGLP